jgi:plastocyanin
MRIRAAAAVLAIALTSAACAGSNGTGGSGGAPPTSAASSPSSQDTTGGGGKYDYGSSSPSTSGGSGPASLTIKQANYQFSPATPTAKEGATIRITNSTTTTPHTFTIAGTPIDLTIDPSTSQTVKLDLPPGTYPFICRFHASSGMKGTLTISDK